MGNSEDRHLPAVIVNSVYYSVNSDVNAKVMFMFGQPHGLAGSRIVYQTTDRPEDAASIALGHDRLILSGDDLLAQKLIACHAVAAQKRMTRTSRPDRHGAT